MKINLEEKIIRSFYKTDDFPKLKLFDQNWKGIKEELELVVKEQDKYEKPFFQPWVEKDLYEESNENGWDVAPLLIKGNRIETNINKVPFLMSIVDKVPGILTCSFSLLKPGTRIVPHKGYDNYADKVLRYHLGLIIPRGDIGIRVDKEVTYWEAGRSFIFDDHLVHEAWNFSEEYRYVLIMDFIKDGFGDEYEQIIKDDLPNQEINFYLK